MSGIFSQPRSGALLSDAIAEMTGNYSSLFPEDAKALKISLKKNWHRFQWLVESEICKLAVADILRQLVGAQLEWNNYQSFQRDTSRL